MTARVGVTIREDGVVEIKRSKGTILMDPADFEGFSGSIMLAFAGGYLRPYVQYWNGGDKRDVSLGVAILGRREGMVVDHINGDRLDNRRSNLRHATRRENAWNSRKYKHTASAYKGVRPSGNCWRAVIYDGPKQIGLGHYKTEVEAARAYDRAARERRGAFAALNFPSEGEQTALRSGS